MAKQSTNQAKPQAAPASNAAAATAPATAPATEAQAKTTKSIVPSKYAGRYKGGGSDQLADFIKAQCKDDKGEFSFPQFFALCRKNGLPEEKVAHYEGQIADKRNGSQGRARMTLRNMLATIARKNGKLIGIDGAESGPITLPKMQVPGKKVEGGEQAQAAA